MPNLLFDRKFYTKDAGGQHVELAGVAVTPTDGVDLPDGPCRGLYITGGGNVRVSHATPTGSASATTFTVTSGTTLMVAVQGVAATLTTATGIYALYPAGNL